MKREQILNVLYDLATATGSEVSVEPLLTKALQRLLYHTGYPCGLVLLYGQGGGSHGGFRDARLAVSIGDAVLAEHGGEVLRLPAELLEGRASILEEPALFASLPCRDGVYSLLFRLPIPDTGAILLLSPKPLHSNLPMEEMFQPILANLAKQIDLCRTYDAHQHELELKVVEQTKKAGRVERDFHALVEQSPFSIQLFSPDGETTAVNPAWERLWGLSPDEIMGYNILKDQQLAEKGVLPYIEKGFAGESVTIPVINYDPAENEKLQGARDDRWVRAFIYPLKDHDGSVQQVVLMHEDVTERILAEREKEEQREKMEHVQRLESLGVLAGGIAHDFNNLLTVIMGNASIAASQLPEFSPAIRNIRSIEETSRRAADLCKQMLAYSGKGKLVVKPIILSDLVEEMSQLLRVSIAKNISFRFNLNSRIPAVDADVTQMQQVIMNLVINASEAIGDNGGAISIATGLQHIDKQYLSTTFLDENLDEGSYVYLEVSDTGCGMDENTKERLFEPFFTTKFTGRGLGMAAILGIVRGHHGTVKVYSEKGKGTTFKVLLPCSEQQAVAVNTARGESAGWSASGCILIVDDEASIREVTASMLEDMGFEILTAADGVEGVEMFRTHHNRVAAILLDMTMPRMGGEDAFSEMCRIDPDVKVILTSGYNEMDATSRFAGKGLAGFIQKPYTAEELGAKMSHILNKTQAAGFG